MSMQILDDTEFGGAQETIMILVATGDATLQIKNADGGWVNFPGGGLSNEVKTFDMPFDAVLRCLISSGTVMKYG